MAKRYCRMSRRLAPLRVRDGLAWVAKEDGTAGEPLKVGDSYIKEMYSEAAEAVKERSGIKPPRLRILRSMEEILGGKGARLLFPANIQGAGRQGLLREPG